jgi:hypothetical protein
MVRGLLPYTGSLILFCLLTTQANPARAQGIPDAGTPTLNTCDTQQQIAEYESTVERRVYYPSGGLKFLITYDRATRRRIKFTRWTEDQRSNYDILYCYTPDGAVATLEKWQKQRIVHRRHLNTSSSSHVYKKIIAIEFYANSSLRRVVTFAYNNRGERVVKRLYLPADQGHEILYSYVYSHQTARIFNFAQYLFGTPHYLTKIKDRIDTRYTYTNGEAVAYRDYMYDESTGALHKFIDWQPNPGNNYIIPKRVLFYQTLQNRASFGKVLLVQLSTDEGRSDLLQHFVYEDNGALSRIDRFQFNPEGNNRPNDWDETWDLSRQIHFSPLPSDSSRTVRDFVDLFLANELARVNFSYDSNGQLTSRTRETLATGGYFGFRVRSYQLIEQCVQNDPRPLYLCGEGLAL